MKKLFLIAAVALGLGAMTSCNGACEANKGASQEDSLAACLGEMYGYGVAGEMTAMNDSTFSKKDFLAGLQTTLKLGEDKASYMQGLQMGMQINNMFKQIKEREQVDIEAGKWLASFKKAFMSDSLQDPNQYQATVMRLMKELSEKVKQNDPEAVKNSMLQKSFIADSLANNPEIKISEGGVYYKINKEGNGEKFQKNDRIMLIYTGKHLNGEEFDSSLGQAVPMSPAGVIAGFGEMLQLMSPGANYTLYIPAALAYGIDGGGPIGKNEMLIFEVETVGLEEK